MTEFLGTASATTKVILGIKGVTIDNLTFQLHYKVTTAILMIGAALTTSKQFLGDPIACEVVNKHHGPIQIFNGYKCISYNFESLADQPRLDGNMYRRSVSKAPAFC